MHNSTKLSSNTIKARILFSLLWTLSATLSASLPTLAQSCSVSVQGVDFGQYNIFSPADTEIQGSINYECPDIPEGELAIDIYLSPGNSNSYNERHLEQTPASSTPLKYNLYLDSNHQNVWGDTSTGNFYSNNAVPNNKAVSIPVFGRIPAGQTNVSVGNYSDSIIVTIDFSML